MIVFPEYRRVNPTARDTYKHEGMGIGADHQAAIVLEEKTTYRIAPNQVFMEVGCGQMKLLEYLIFTKHAEVYGYDIHVDYPTIRHLQERAREQNLHTNLHVIEMDASHTDPGHAEDTFDGFFCTETIEHMTNPYFMLACVKRMLKHGAPLVLSYPGYDRQQGYGGGKHAFIYPGLFKRECVAVFMRQMFFKEICYFENGGSDWGVWVNYKGEGVRDPISMTTGNYDDETLFKELDQWTPNFQAA